MVPKGSTGTFARGQHVQWAVRTGKRPHDPDLPHRQTWTRRPVDCWWVPMARGSTWRELCRSSRVRRQRCECTVVYYRDCDWVLGACLAWHRWLDNFANALGLAYLKVKRGSTWSTAMYSLWLSDWINETVSCRLTCTVALFNFSVTNVITLKN